MAERRPFRELQLHKRRRGLSFIERHEVESLERHALLLPLKSTCRKRYRHILCIAPRSQLEVQQICVSIRSLSHQERFMSSTTNRPKMVYVRGMNSLELDCMLPLMSIVALPLYVERLPSNHIANAEEPRNEMHLPIHEPQTPSSPAGVSIANFSHIA
jgi:hypothetical protein